ncbi:hypothetical protein [Massilia sp. YMA4]|uniref:hypothetical protein n=1 Tax=Massilia sp. YMA4 TaxID=1593482 RepID=UPI000DD11621|nr:hypothetical protein [Massilia sp. YMA4]AXA94023.1 hypothetical protein DPH57_24565 [Massilia sp. YMA4]
MCFTQAARYLAVAAGLLHGAYVQAEIVAETSCYARTSPGKDARPVRMVFRRYIDQELKKEVGALVQYNQSKDVIPLLFIKHVDTDTDSAELGNHEMTRVEIVGGKAAGDYLFVQTGAGNRQGKYVRYTSAKAGDGLAGVGGGVGGIRSFGKAGVEVIDAASELAATTCHLPALQPKD